MSRGCSGGAFAATITTTTSTLAAIARARRAIVRVGAREQAAARQHRGHAVTLAARFEQHLVADGEAALLAAREVGGQGGVQRSPPACTTQAPARHRRSRCPAALPSLPAGGAAPPARRREVRRRVPPARPAAAGGSPRSSGGARRR